MAKSKHCSLYSCPFVSTIVSSFSLVHLSFDRAVCLVRRAAERAINTVESHSIWRRKIEDQQEKKLDGQCVANNLEALAFGHHPCDLG